MENAIRFLTTVGVIVIAGVVFSFAQAKEINFGSVADWAGAIANLLVVCVTLWLALSDRIRINNWDEAAFILLMVLATVALIDGASRWLRLRLIRA